MMGNGKPNPPSCPIEGAESNAAQKTNFFFGIMAAKPFQSLNRVVSSYFRSANRFASTKSTRVSERFRKAKISTQSKDPRGM